MFFEGKITALTPVEGMNKYNMPYKGYRATIVEANIPDGQQYRNACSMYIPDNGQVIKVGDVGTVECAVDIKQGTNGAFTTVNCRNFTITQEGAF